MAFHDERKTWISCDYSGCPNTRLVDEHGQPTRGGALGWLAVTHFTPDGIKEDYCPDHAPALVEAWRVDVCGCSP